MALYEWLVRDEDSHVHAYTHAYVHINTCMHICTPITSGVLQRKQ